MPKLVYDIEFNIDSSNASRVASTASKGVEKFNTDLKQSFANYQRLQNVSEDTFNEITAGANRAAQAQRRINQSFGRSGRSLTGFNKAANNSNQILFSFSDATQDAAQFQFGFAQGARAVGNNLTFAAEQIALANQKTGGIKNTFQALGAALLGPAGVVFAINALVTLVTVLPAFFKESAEEAEELNKTVDDLTDSFLRLSDLNDVSTKGLLDTASATNILATRFERYVGILRSSGNNDLADIYAKQAEELRNQADEATKRRNELIRIIQLQQSINKQEIKNTFQNIQNNEKQLDRLEILEEQLALYVRQDGVAGILFGTLDEQLRVQRGIIRVERRNVELKQSLGLLSRVEAENQKAILDNKLLELSINERLAKQEAESQLPSNQPLTDNIANELFLSNQRATFDIAEEQKRDFEKRITEIDKDAADKRNKISEAEADVRKFNLQQIAQATSFIVRGLFGDTKAGAIATATIDSYVAFNKALASAPPPLNYGLAAGVLASGLAQVAKIRNTNFGDSGGGGGGTSRASVQSNFVQRNGSRDDVPSFIPSRSTLNQQPTFVIEQKIKNRELALTVREGNKRIRANQVASRT